MKMKILMVSKLLASTNTLVIASYTIFSLSTIYLLFLASFNYVNVWILISLLICLMHHYLSFRVKFDAELLSYLSTQIHNHDIENSLDTLTQQLDQSLIEFKLMNKNKAGRDWTLRLQGCLKLFKMQIALLILQCIFFIAIIML